MAVKSFVLFVFLLYYLVGTVESTVPDAKKIENLEKQVRILANLVEAQSNVLAKFSCQAQSGGSLTSECIVKVANQTKVIEKLQGELNSLDTRSKTQDSQIKQLHSSVADLSKKTTEQQNRLTSVDTKVSTDVSTLRSEVKNVEQNINTLGSKVAQLGTQVQQLSGNWPSGKYCILASGTCPPGFTRSSSYMRALSLYSGNSGYIKQSTFGDSKIKCHGNCGQYGHWTGELYITACCK